MKISVVIPTYKREKDLSECLDSILGQSFLPVEVFVIDNARENATKASVQGQKEIFSSRGIRLEYIDNSKENSLTVARNWGIKMCGGDVISFLDDDVILDKDYYKEVAKFFNDNDKAIGVSAQTIGNLYETSKIKFMFAQLLGRIFFLGYYEKYECHVLPSMGVTSLMGNNSVSSEWISGASAYKRKIFSEFLFDEKLKKYSWDEDLDFSYRIYKKYPGTLFFNSRIKYLHKLSEIGRTQGRERIYMEEIYNLYLFYKLMPQNLKNKIIYIWSRIGTIFYRLVKGKFLDTRLCVSALILCLKNLHKIKQGNLDFFNKTLK